jgi:hypothetical protein
MDIGKFPNEDTCGFSGIDEATYDFVIIVGRIK